MLLYKIAHVVRDKLTCLWNFIELVNSWLFSIRFGSKLKSFCFSEILEGYRIVPIKDIATERMVAFFCHQPKEAFVFFHPHGFDAKSIQRLQGNKSFLGYVLLDNANDKIAGYCFNRSFFMACVIVAGWWIMDIVGRGLVPS